MSDDLFHSPTPYATILYDIFDEVIDEEVPPEDFDFNSIYDVKTLNRPEYKSVTTAGAPLPSKRVMLEDLAPFTYEVGDPFTRRPDLYGFRTGFPNELIRRLEKAGGYIDSELGARIGSYAEFLRQGKIVVNWLVDQQGAELFNNATSTGGAYAVRSVNGTAEALYQAHASLSNPAFTQTNFDTNLPLTVTNLFNFVQDIRTQKDPSGKWRARPKRFKLIVAPDLERVAWEILHTREEVGSANNTENIMGPSGLAKMFTVVVWNELTAGSWHVVADTARLKMMWEEKPKFNKEPHGRNNSVEYQMNASWIAPFAESWYGIAGSIVT